MHLLEKLHGIDYTPINDRVLTQEQKAVLDKIISDEDTYYKLDPLLGWSLKKNGYKNKYMFANSQGLRANREYDFEKPKGVFRFLCFGDSFTHGDGVANDLTWPAFLEENTHVEALNFGIAAAGSDMAYLRYKRDGAAYETDVVVLGLMTEDIGRHVMVYWPYYQSFYNLPQSQEHHLIPKPRFVIKNDQLSLIKPLMQTTDDVIKFRDNPEKYLPLFGKNDFYYNAKYKTRFFDFFPSVRFLKVAYHTIKHKNTMKICHYGDETEAVKITLKLIDAFVEEAKEKDALPLIVIFPTETDILEARDGKPRGYQHVLDHLEKNHYPHIDFMTSLEKYAAQMPVDQIIRGHYTPIINKLVAMTIMAYIFKK